MLQIKLAGELARVNDAQKGIEDLTISLLQATIFEQILEGLKPISYRAEWVKASVAINKQLRSYLYSQDNLRDLNVHLGTRYTIRYIYKSLSKKNKDIQIVNTPPNNKASCRAIRIPIKLVKATMLANDKLPRLIPEPLDLLTEPDNPTNGLVDGDHAEIAENIMIALEHKDSFNMVELKTFIERINDGREIFYTVYLDILQLLISNGLIALDDTIITKATSKPP
ncbi:MAG TPA: hypothetical protein VKM55_30840 [Candidatus Lokiarchaeia archaeon]|nr:hypothetical protein [Candidatus Lokiarchaeia archaeon]